MALKLNKPAGSAPSASAGNAAAPAPAKTGGMSFLKRGAKAKEAMAQEEFKAEQRSVSNVRRFWIPTDAETEITFLDGDMLDGILDIPYYYEHNLFLNGSWDNHFICTQDQEPCVICQSGNTPAYVGVLTVIDHSAYVSKKDNKEYKDQKRLYVCKRDTIKVLQGIADKCGGTLRGQRFSVSRTGDKSPNVGNTFFPLKKYEAGQILAEFGKDAVPFDYDDLLGKQYIPNEGLIKLGLGSGGPTIGKESGAQGNFANEM